MTDCELDENLSEDDDYETDGVLEKGATHYNMSHPRRGVAAIFNQDKFSDPFISERRGSQIDCQSLQRTFTRLGFDVETYRDLNQARLEHTLYELSRRDHTNCDCFVLVYMTHGLEGKLRSNDRLFDINLLWDCFTAERCPTLVTKPKLFFIQACQGPGYQKAVVLPSSSNDNSQSPEDHVKFVPSYILPDRADFLVALSTIPGFVSWRAPTSGSWYIQTLCQELDRHGFNKDILTLLTDVSRRVAVEYTFRTSNDSNSSFRKQLPSVITMLIRVLKFKKKSQHSKTRGMKRRKRSTFRGSIEKGDERTSTTSQEIASDRISADRSNLRRRRSSERLSPKNKRKK